MHPNAWVVLQMAMAMLCAAAAFGVLLSAMMLRGRLPVDHPQSALFEVMQSDRAYQLASILASAGAMASLLHSKGAFAGFLSVAISLQLAELWLVPRMREAAAAGAEMPYRGVRTRMELIQAAALALIFVNLGLPPLVVLANIYGLPL
jgi:hypothetical protein